MRYDEELLVCITFLYRLDRMKYLFQVLTGLYNINCTQTKVFVFTEEDDDLKLGPLRRLIQVFQSNRFAVSVISSPSTKPNPRILPWAHKPFVARLLHENTWKFTHFLYLEEDINFSSSNFAYYLRFKDVLKSKGLVPGFVRVELNDHDGHIFTSDQTSKNDYISRTKFVIDGLTFLCLDEPYSAVHIMDRTLLTEYVKSRSFDLRESESVMGWGEPERAAMGLTFENPPPGYHCRTVVPIVMPECVPHVSCLVHHLPNNYANHLVRDANYPLGKIRLDKIFTETPSGCRGDGSAQAAIRPTVVEIESLSSNGRLPAEADEWQHFASLMPSEPIWGALQLFVVPSIPRYAYWQDAYKRADAAPELGCHFLHDIEVRGRGAIFSDDRFITQKSYLSRVAFHEVESQPADHLETDRFKCVVVSDPTLIILGPGWQVYGHWLLDFLPRIFVAQQVLGTRFSDFKLLLPINLPKFVDDLLSYLTSVTDEQIIRYDPDQEVVKLKRACIPNYAHDNYGLHSHIRSIYRRFLSSDVRQPYRRICLSRRKIEKTTLSAVRFFEQREEFEALAVQQGFELILPEELSIKEQITLMAETAVQIGEHGSAQHASIFSESQTVVGTVHPLNNVQVQIGRVCRQYNVIVMADNESKDAGGIIRFNVSTERLKEFFVAVSRAATFRLNPVG